MSLTSYRAAPPRVKDENVFVVVAVDGNRRPEDFCRWQISVSEHRDWSGFLPFLEGFAFCGLAGLLVSVFAMTGEGRLSIRVL